MTVFRPEFKIINELYFKESITVCLAEDMIHMSADCGKWVQGFRYSP